MDCLQEAESFKEKYTEKMTKACICAKKIWAACACRNGNFAKRF